MSENKKSVHKTGALGALIASGQIANVNDSAESLFNKYVTNSGVGFTDDEFTYVDPNECEPWEYANRQDGDFGEIEELKKSIQDQTQLQPVLIRDNVNPDSKFKYEVIFGRRRHQVCKELGIKMMVIRKKSLSLKEALKLQHIENEQRKNVSNYSNAMIYKRLLDNNIYKTQRALALALDLAPATINDYMYYTKLEQDILKKIGSAIHKLSVPLVRKIVIMSENNGLNKNLILQLSDKLGTKIITPAQLTTEINKLQNDGDSSLQQDNISLLDLNDKKLLELKRDYRGNIKINISKDAITEERYKDFFEHIKSFFSGSKVLVD